MTIIYDVGGVGGWGGGGSEMVIGQTNVGIPGNALMCLTA